MAVELDGPRLAPQSGGPARQLVVLLHGYGADGNDLIEIGRAWQGLLPHCAFVSPHAPAALVLVGFSQGTMMALHVGLRRQTAPRAIVGYSGLLVEPPPAQAEKFLAEIRSHPPVLLVHGDRDELIPVQALFHAANGLATLGLTVAWHVSAGIGHGIDQDGLRYGGEFIRKVTGGR